MAYDNPYSKVLWTQSPEQLEQERLARSAGGPAAQLGVLQSQGFGQPEGIMAEAQRQIEAQKQQQKYQREDEVAAAKRKHEFEMEQYQSGQKDLGTKAALKAFGIETPEGLSGSGLDLFYKESMARQKEERAAQEPMSPYQEAVIAGQKQTRERAAQSAGTKALDAAYKGALEGVPSDFAAAKDMPSARRALQRYHESGGKAQIIGHLDPATNQVFFENVGGEEAPDQLTQDLRAAPDVEWTPSNEYNPDAPIDPTTLAAMTRSGVLTPPEDEELGDVAGGVFDTMQHTDPVFNLLQMLRGG